MAAAANTAFGQATVTYNLELSESDPPPALYDLAVPDLIRATFDDGTRSSDASGPISTSAGP